MVLVSYLRGCLERKEQLPHCLGSYTCFLDSPGRQLCVVLCCQCLLSEYAQLFGNNGCFKERKLKTPDYKVKYAEAWKIIS